MTIVAAGTLFILAIVFMVGLAIAAALVQGHGGSLQAAASALGGLRIRIEFPAEGNMHG